jgi:hypothetical protein
MSPATQDAIRQIRRPLRSWGRGQPDPFIRNRCNIVIANLDRVIQEPGNTRLQIILACNVGELEELIRTSPHLITRGPAVREARRRISRSKSEVARPKWVAAINSIVAGFMPPDRRDDIKQGACLLMLEGATSDPRSAVKEASTHYNRLHGTWRNRSFDAPIWGTDGWTRHDVMASQDTEGEDDETHEFD